MVQIQPRKRTLYLADCAGLTRQHELEHTRSREHLSSLTDGDNHVGVDDLSRCEFAHGIHQRIQVDASRQHPAARVPSDRMSLCCVGFVYFGLARLALVGGIFTSSALHTASSVSISFALFLAQSAASTTATTTTTTNTFARVTLHSTENHSPPSPMLLVLAVIQRASSAKSHRPACCNAFGVHGCSGVCGGR